MQFNLSYQENNNKKKKNNIPCYQNLQFLNSHS